MKKKSWHLNRRTFLKSSSVCIALPWLEAMGSDSKKTSPRRFFAGFFPYGVPIHDAGSPNALKLGWYPIGTGKNYKTPEMHKAFNPVKDKVTFLSGLSHPGLRGGSAHRASDTLLTGANTSLDYSKQSISIDQLLSNNLGNNTRFKSMVLSSVGGVNRPYRTSTMSFDRAGSPISALNKPSEIFRRMFGEVSMSERNSLSKKGSIIDSVFEETKRLNLQLGVRDKEKMDEFLTSVREVERMTEREVEWLKTPKPKVDASGLDLTVTIDDPEKFITTMYDLVVLALQTDSTRFITYQVACEDENFLPNFPMAVGISNTAHHLSHESKSPELSKYIGFLTGLYANFLKKLDSIKEGNSSLLDNTVCFYGCSTSKTHKAANYPLTLSGGKTLGFKHGSHLKFDESKVPLSNLFFTISNQFNLNLKKFADSTADIGEVLV